MPTDDIVLLAVVVLAAALAVLTWLRVTGRLPGRASGVAPVPCAYRGGAQEEWARGVLRYDGNRLDHYDRGGMSPRLRHQWSRGSLDLGRARTVPGGEVPLPGGAGTGVVVVDCTDGRHRFELGLGTPHYTALRAWVEAVPPGWNANRA